MSHATNVKRFRSNPIEVIIFSVIAIVFMNSVYQLCYDQSNFQLLALTPMKSTPLSEGRAPASASQTLLNLDILCSTPIEMSTGANKVRLNGPLCGMDEKLQGTQIAHLIVANTNNKMNATIFSNLELNKFSTDYIPLSPGENRIHLEFSYNDGKSFSQDIHVRRD